jgi:NADH-quinone oxidoreductase subunit L
MPLTFWTMVIAGLSLAGIFPLSGFWSKDTIVASAFEEHYYVLFAMALLTVFLTAFYIFRAIFMAFTGEPRTEAARLAVDPPGIMIGPMIVLALLSIVSGWVGIPEGFGLPSRDYFAEFVAPSGFATETLALEPHSFSFVLAAISILAGLSGIGAAYALYVRSPEMATSLAERFSGLHGFLDKGWYFDALYGATFVRGAKALGRAAKVFDQKGLDRGVRGVGGGFSKTGGFLQRLQTGGVQNYALFILLSALVIGVIVGAVAGAAYTMLVVALVVIITLAAVSLGVRL